MNICSANNQAFEGQEVKKDCILRAALVRNTAVVKTVVSKLDSQPYYSSLRYLILRYKNI